MKNNRDSYEFMRNYNGDFAQDTMNELVKIKGREQEAKRAFETCQYNGFYLVNEYAVSYNEKILISSSVISTQKEVIMKSSNDIEIVSLGDLYYLINSNEQTLIVEIVAGEVEVLTSVSALKASAMYKMTEYLNSNGLVVLTNYSKDERRNFEYLYDYKTGKRISSGFDTIDEVNGKLKVTYGLANGNLDLEGNFVMEPDVKQVVKPQGIFTRLFKK